MKVSRNKYDKGVIKTSYAALMTKAYKDFDFLNSPDARPLRILAEYMQPKKRLEEMGIHRAITFWGSARIQPGHSNIRDGRDYYEMARALAHRLAKWTLAKHAEGQRYHILTGAGPGVMEAAHAGAAEVDPKINVGLNISLPFEQCVNPYIPPEHIFEFHYFFTRKFWFIELARAMVVFPGGFGTLDELFELLTLMQTGKHHKRPVLLFGDAYWQEVINLEALVQQGLIDPSDPQLVIHADDVDIAFQTLTEALESNSAPTASP